MFSLSIFRIRMTIARNNETEFQFSLHNMFPLIMIYRSIEEELKTTIANQLRNDSRMEYARD